MAKLKLKWWHLLAGVGVGAAATYLLWPKATKALPGPNGKTNGNGNGNGKPKAKVSGNGKTKTNGNGKPKAKVNGNGKPKGPSKVEIATFNAELQAELDTLAATWEATSNQISEAFFADQGAALVSLMGVADGVFAEFEDLQGSLFDAPIGYDNISNKHHDRLRRLKENARKQIAKVKSSPLYAAAGGR